MPSAAAAPATAEPPPFARVGLVGVGLIGGSIGLAVRRRWPAVLRVGVDRNEVLERAVARHAIDVGADDLGMLKEVDLVVLAAPVAQILAVLQELPAWVAGETVVTDTGSTKRAIVAAARGLPPRLRFVGGHPLAGAARSGVDAARADLFDGRSWLLVPVPETPADAAARLERFVRGLGAEPVSIDAERHDQCLAAVSHLPQLAASALMHVVGEAVGDAGLALSGPGLEDTTRLASSPPAVWLDICRTNADHLGAALDALIAVLVELRGDLERGERIEQVLASANAWKRRLQGGADRADR